MKIAKVVPIYKSKEKDKLTNYRPVSLLPAISKILEKVVYKRTFEFINMDKIFYKSQYGFRAKHSTINAVTEFVNNVEHSLDKRESTLSVFLDLSKAFDTIDNVKLLLNC